MRYAFVVGVMVFVLGAVGCSCGDDDSGGANGGNGHGDGGGLDGSSDGAGKNEGGSNGYTAPQYAELWYSVDDLLVHIRRAAPFISGVTVSGGEATQQAGFVHTLCEAIKANPALHRLTCFVDTNGSCPTTVWDELEHVVDGVMVDLKCLDDEIHHELTGRSNEATLASIRHLAGQGRLYEVRLLLVAGYYSDKTFPTVPCAMKELHMVWGTLYGHHAAGRAVESAAALLARTPAIARALVTHRMPLDAARDAFALVESDAPSLKVVLEP